jgi:hypothetical protein
VLVSIGRAGASKTRRLITLLSVGWLPPDLPPSGACLIRGTSVPCGLLTPSRVTPNRGCASSDAQAKPSHNSGRTFNGLTLWSQRDRLGNSPHKCTQFPRDSDDHLVGIFPSGASLSVALAQAYLRLPTAILDRLGYLLQASLQMPTDFGRVAIGPSAFDQGTAGMAVARLGEASLLAPLSRRVFRGG